jgi:DNA-binding MarR family transcriptional regulator
VKLTRLEAAGLLRREIDSADLRRHRLVLTPEGRKAMTRGLTLLSNAFGARLGRLSTAQQTSLRTLLEKLN